MSNYTLTIAATNIAPSSLSPGHAWIQISDGTTTTSYGYYPREGFDYVFGDPGEVKKDYDKEQHPNPDWKQDIPVTKEQYEKLRDFAEKTKDNPLGYDLSGAAGGIRTFSSETTRGVDTCDGPSFSSKESSSSCLSPANFASMSISPIVSSCPCMRR